MKAGTDPKKNITVHLHFTKKKTNNKKKKQDTVLEYDLPETENIATFSSLNFGNTKYEILTH